MSDVSDSTGSDTSKVISIFQRHRRGDTLHFPVEEGGELIISPDGFNYVSFRQEKPAGDHAGDILAQEYLEVAHCRHYIFSFLENHKEFVRVDNYYVSGDKLTEFLKGLSKRPGKLIEIKPFIPDGTA